jgi:hypothetical protein
MKYIIIFKSVLQLSSNLTTLKPNFSLIYYLEKIYVVHILFM